MIALRWPVDLGRAIAFMVASQLLLSAACTGAEDALQEPRYVLIVGIDVSGSFRTSTHYSDALDYLAHYLYGHLNGMGELETPSHLFVGTVGGDTPGETKGFHPIHDFRGKDVEQIAADLQEWFPEEDRLTDFNAFFERIAELTQRQGLVLAPMNIVLVTDGVPDLELMAAENVETDPYATIDLDPLEYLSRNITVRLLYPEPTVAAEWERRVTRQRVRIWTTDSRVMNGWRAQLEPEAPLEEQDALWTWTADNVDFRVRSRMF